MKSRTELEVARTAELKRKSLSITVVMIPALIGLELVFYRANAADTISRILMAILILSMSFHYFLVRFSKQAPIAWQKTTTLLSLLLGVAWGAFLFRAAVLGRDSPSIRLLVFLVGIAFSTMSVYSVAIKKSVFQAFLTPIMISMTAAFLVAGEAPLTDRAVGLILFVFLYAVASAQGNIIESGWERSQRYALELQSLMDTFPGGILVISQGIVTRTNAYFNNLFAHEEVLKKLFELPEFVRNLKQLENNPDLDRADFEVNLRIASSKRAFWFLLVKAEGGTPDTPQIVVVGLDVQAKKDADDEIELQRKRLETSSRLAALGEMAGGIAHEINNPIFVISSRVQLILFQMEKGSLAEKKFAPHFNAILETCDRIVKIVRGLRQVSRSSDNEALEVTSFRGLIEQTIGLCEARVNRSGARLEVNILSHDCAAEIRPVQISQVLVNLLNNAFDAIEGTESPWIRIEVKGQENRLEITVTDSGNGIPSEIRSRIMEPFFTTKSYEKGTGLGLSISQGILKAHQGQLVLDEESPNTRFVIRLPKQQNRSLA